MAPEKSMEDSFRNAFFRITKTLDSMDIGKVCSEEGIDVEAFGKWIASMPVHRAKFDEVCETIAIENKKSKK